MNTRAKYLVVISSTFLVLLLLLGTVLGKGTTPDNPYRHLQVYTEVVSRIKSEYVEEPDMKSVTLGALNGLLESIDPFASYLNADQYKEYQKHNSGYKGDVGLILSKRFGYIGVVSAIPGSPAAKAGLSTGDIIETIKGVATRDMPLAYATLLLHGDPGSTVEITVLRRRPEPQKMTLTRAALNPPPVTSKLMPNDVGYIRPETLSAARVQEIAADLRRQGRHPRRPPHHKLLQFRKIDINHRGRIQRQNLAQRQATHHSVAERFAQLRTRPAAEHQR